MRTAAKVTMAMLMMIAWLGWGGTALAETGIATGAGGDADARLDFEINIPAFIVFTVGSAGAGNIDTVVFDPNTGELIAPASNVAASSNGTVNVSVISNGGQVTIYEANDGSGSGLDNGSGNFISYAQIMTTESSGDIPAPQLSNAGANSSIVPLTLGSVTAETDQWTYTFVTPATPPAPGTYSGRVTYTASIP